MDFGTIPMGCPVLCGIWHYAYGMPCFMRDLALFLWDALFHAGFGIVPMGCPVLYVLSGIWPSSYVLSGICHRIAAIPHDTYISSHTAPHTKTPL